MSTCKLRPHHALCIGFFRGKGYSEAFVSNMTEIIDTLRTQNPLLTLQSAADDVCRCCPHNRGDVCDSAEKVSHYDAAVLRLAGLSDGTQLHWSELAALIRKHIIEPSKLFDVCGDCQWFEICGNTTYR